MGQDMLSSSQAAEYLGVTRQRVDQLGSAGVIPRERMGFFWIYRKGDLDRWNAEGNRNIGRPKSDLKETQINRGPELVTA